MYSIVSNVKLMFEMHVKLLFKHTTLILITSETVHYSSSSEATDNDLWPSFEMVIEIDHPLCSQWLDSA